MRASVLILVNIPFAMVGGIVSLWASGEYLSVPASVGFIALLGIAVLNGLVMVTYFRQLRADGRSMTETVRLGAERRLRPVLMTASITAFEIGRAHVCTPVTNAHLECRPLLEQKKHLNQRK